MPKHAPPNGYGVLVFVPPWDQAAVPAQWIDALDHHGLIFVAAARSGNDADVMQRREPLALLAASNVLHRYPVDVSRVYVGGFSGGSRVAERLALGYPDLFHGALLNAGSDPIGTPEVPLPASNLLERFQTSSRLVYLTGKNDVDRLDMDRRSRKAMNEWCVFDITPLAVPWSGHETPNAAAFSRGLNALEQHDPADPDKLNACRAHYREQLLNDVELARSLEAKGDSTAAAEQLQKIDSRSVRTLLTSSPASTCPARRVSARRRDRRSNPVRLPVEGGSPSQAIEPSPPSTAPRIVPEEPDPGRGVLDGFQGRLQGVGRPGRRTRSGSGRRGRPPSIGRPRRPGRRQERAKAIGSPGPWTSSSSCRVSGPPRLTTSTGPFAAPATIADTLRPERRGRGADLAVDRRRGPDDPADRPSGPPPTRSTARPARRIRAGSRP